MKLSTTTGVLARKFGDAQAIKMIAEAGFQAYDIAMYYIQITDSPFSEDGYMEYIKELKKTADECGIVCNQAHAPFPTQLNGNDEYNEKTLALIIRCMECASILGADVVVVHPIKNSSSSLAKDHPYVPFESRAQLYDANVKFFKDLIPYCEKYNIKIAVENMWERHPKNRNTLIPATFGYAEDHKRFLDDIDSKWIVACLDIRHALICGENPQDSIRILGNKHLKSLHVHDCNGYEDSHALPYAKAANWDEILKALAETGYDGDFTFEAEGLKLILDEMLEEANVRILYHTSFLQPVIEENTIKGAYVSSKAGIQLINAKIVIDCTGDGDVAARSGVPFEMGNEELGLIQPATMFYHISNVDTDKVEADIQANVNNFYRKDGVNYRSLHWRVSEARENGDDKINIFACDLK